jgi:hypothetical protein
MRFAQDHKSAGRNGKHTDRGLEVEDGKYRLTAKTLIDGCMACCVEETPVPDDLKRTVGSI